ncbi:hypothetical protein LSPH24S_06474 [Lysinibacillus sphaericus]
MKYVYIPFISDYMDFKKQYEFIHSKKYEIKRELSYRLYYLKRRFMYYFVSVVNENTVNGIKL